MDNIDGQQTEKIDGIDFVRHLITECRYDDAFELLGRMEEEDPDNYEINYELARLQFEMGDYYSAIANYEVVLENHQSPVIFYNLGCAYIKIGEYRKDKNALLDAVYFKSTEPDFHYNLAYVYKKLNKTKDAELYLGYYNKLINDRK